MRCRESVVRIRNYEKILSRQDRNMLAIKRSYTEFLVGPPWHCKPPREQFKLHLYCARMYNYTKDCNSHISEIQDRRDFKINANVHGVCGWVDDITVCERKSVQWLRLSQPRQFNFVQFVRCWLNIQFAESGQRARCDACAVNVQRWMQRIQRERPWWTHGHCTCQQRIVQLSGVGSDIMYRTCSDTR